MKIVQINTTCGVGSTGKICVSISELLDEKNIDNYILYSAVGEKRNHAIQNSDRRYIRAQAIRARLLGNWGFNSGKATKKIIAHIEKLKPDIVHLHNIHGHDCNLSMLFKYFKKVNQKLIWTFHDCWTFTGYCMHFTMAQCDKWKTGCKHCPQYKPYSLFLDRSSSLYNKKRAIFSGLDLTIITPSHWLADLAKQSIFREYPVKVIHNGIDLSVFQPTESNCRETYGIPKDKYIVLGVAFGWGKKKGLDVFAELSRRLDDRFQIVLVGTDEKTDKQLPERILSIHRTRNQEELAKIYTAADVFFNPTREEALGLVNVEALACGTPVITFNTGGSPECIDETCGVVVDREDIDIVEKEIIRICTLKPYSKENCLNRAAGFDKNIKFMEYVNTYLQV